MRNVNEGSFFGNRRYSGRIFVVIRGTLWETRYDKEEKEEEERKKGKKEKKKKNGGVA